MRFCFTFILCIAAISLATSTENLTCTILGEICRRCREYNVVDDMTKVLMETCAKELEGLEVKRCDLLQYSCYLAYMCIDQDCKLLAEITKTNSLIILT